MKDNSMDKSRRRFLAGTGALAVGSMLPISFYTKDVFAAQAEPWLNTRVENIAQMEQIAPFIEMPAQAKILLRQQATDFCKNRLDKNLSPALKKLIGKTTLGAIAPVFMIFFDLIFPADAPTWDEIKDEIDKRIKTALDEYEYRQISKDFEALLDAYALRMETVKNNNTGITDQSKWDLGSPQDWEALINMCLKIKNYFYNNSSFSNYYESAYLVNDFNFIYYIALNARLQCFKEGDDVGQTAGLMVQLLKGWKDYCEKLGNIAYHDIYQYKDIYMRDLMYKGYMVVNRFGHDSLYDAPALSGYDKHDRIIHTYDIIKERIRLYHLLATPTIAMCEAQSVAAKSFNKLFGQSVEIANTWLDEFLSDWYVRKANYYWHESPYSDGGGKHGLTLPGWYNFGYKEFRRDEAYAFINGRIYPPGDYINLADLSDSGSPVYNSIKKIQLPRGLVVMFYSEPNYGEYTEEGSDEVLYKGKGFYAQDSLTLPDFIPKSMKVRVDPKNWFGMGHQLGRIPVIKYKWVNDAFWTTGDMEMAARS